MSSVPTDSVLRRHYEQTWQAARAVPTDSVLRRHHDQMQQAVRLEAESSRAPESAEPASPEPQPAARPADAPAPAVSARGGGGFIGWLKRLFGG